MIKNYDCDKIHSATFFEFEYYVQYIHTGYTFQVFFSNICHIQVKLDFLYDGK